MATAHLPNCQHGQRVGLHYGQRHQAGPSRTVHPSTFFPHHSRLLRRSSGDVANTGHIPLHPVSRPGNVPVVRALAFFDVPEAGPLRDILFASGGATIAFTLSAALAWVMQRNFQKVKTAAEERGPASMPESPNVPVGLSGLEMGMGGQKESVEWVNMVLHKIWKIYRRSLEAWLVGLLQPAIDTLPLPAAVRRVEIAEFSLDYEPLSVRNVQRRASRRANDLQYHVALRYTGDARCLLLLHLTVAGMDFAVPVGVHNLDVEAELWVKLRLTPRQPYVGTLSIGFVRLPTIKLVLAPFRIVNLFAIPFLSSFLSKLLTVDLPRLLVLPRHITFDFLPAGEDESNLSAMSNQSLVLDLLKSETFTGLAGHKPQSSHRMEPNDAFVGELSVTLCEARNLPTFGLAVFSNPYCRLMVGDTVVESKKNSETSHPAGARDPVWNQDFLFWVEDPMQQKLTVVIRDSMAPLSRNIGFVEMPIWQLQDCAPLSMWLPLLQDGPFGVKPAQGEVRLLLTYKSYVDPAGGLSASPSTPSSASTLAYIKVFGESEETEDGDVDETTEENDSDGERERELQKERAAKGLDRLGEEPGVEVVASNEGQIHGPLIGAPPLVPLDAPELVNTSDASSSVAGAVWGATKGLAGGVVGAAGAVVGAAGWALGGMGGAIVAGGGAAISRAGAVASGIGSKVKEAWGPWGEKWERHKSESLYEDDDDDDAQSPPVWVKSYPQARDEARNEDADADMKNGMDDFMGPGVNGTSTAASLHSRSRGSGYDDDGYHTPTERLAKELGDASAWDDVMSDYGSDGKGDRLVGATVEQRVARLVEWNLENGSEELLSRLASMPRAGTSLDSDEGWRSSSGSRSDSEVEDAASTSQPFSGHATGGVHRTAHSGGYPSAEKGREHLANESFNADQDDGGGPAKPEGESSDRWKNVHGAITDLMDFFHK